MGLFGIFISHACGDWVRLGWARGAAIGATVELANT